MPRQCRAPARASGRAALDRHLSSAERDMVGPGRQAVGHQRRGCRPDRRLTSGSATTITTGDSMNALASAIAALAALLGAVIGGTIPSRAARAGRREDQLEKRRADAVAHLIALVQAIAN